MNTENLKSIAEETKSNNSLQSLTLSDVNLSNYEYKFINKPELQYLVDKLYELLNQENTDIKFILPLLMSSTKNIKENKKEIILELLVMTLQDEHSKLYSLIEHNPKFNKQLIQLAPNMIDIIYNISSNGFKKYENKIIVDEDELINYIVENTKDLHLQKNIKKEDLFLLVSNLLMAIISIVEVQQLNGSSKKRIVQKVIIELIKENEYVDEDFINSIPDLIDIFVKVAKGDFDLNQEEMEKCCSLFNVMTLFLPVLYKKIKKCF